MSRTKRREEEKTTLHNTTIPNLINTKPKLPMINPSASAPEDRERPQEKQKDQGTNYYPPEPIYIPTYKENAPEPAPEKEKKQKVRKTRHVKIQGSCSKETNILPSYASSCRDNKYFHHGQYHHSCCCTIFR